MTTMTNETTSRSAVVTLPTDTQILVTREFAAAKHLVFRAYTEPDLISRWWTSKRGSMKVCEVDLRVGGKWRFVMDADGFEVGFHGEYREIVPDERLVATEVYEGAPVPEGEEEHAAINTLTLTEVDGRTTLTLLTECGTKEVRDVIIESGMEDGLQDGFDLLEEVARSIA
jgi:uncharacterized protein YndB with AHSA1/START domain